VVPSRAVVVDIDGVLSDASRRQHYIESPRQDWRAFFEACGEDPVIEEVHTLLDLLDPELQIVLLTARPHRVAYLTVAWLRRYEIPWDLLITRPWGDYEVARDFKQSAVWELRSAGFRPVLAFEDDRRNVAMFRSEGIPCLYVHSGYYD
jgi:phosphoglycolate phosphatase-like HAD superfamily hydrolase